MNKDEFIELLKCAKLNKKEFAEIANLPYSTVNGWGVNRKGRVLETPNWVKQFLLLYMKAKKFDLLKEQICEIV